MMRPANATRLKNLKKGARCAVTTAGGGHVKHNIWEKAHCFWYCVQSMIQNIFFNLRKKVMYRKPVELFLKGRLGNTSVQLSAAGMMMFCRPSQKLANPDIFI